jgi:Amt family ammonium transporter
VGVHGVGGTWGALATGLFASTALSDGGLFTGNPGQLTEQLIGVLATYVLAGLGTLAILGLLNATLGLRVHEEDEAMGLDLSLHAEAAYTATGSGSALGERPRGH